MSENSGQRAQEWLEQQLTELAELRNATRRDPKFKQWRQQTATVLQRIWPRDARRVDRFRRIPYSPPIGNPTDRQNREFFERGWGEAGVLLRQLLAEVIEKGIVVPDLDETMAPASLPPPTLELARREDAPPVARPAPPRRAPPASAATPPAGDDISRAMGRLLERSPVFRVQKAEAPRRTSDPRWDAPSAPGELVGVAGELGSLGVPAANVDEVRRVLVALDRAGRNGEPTWDLLREALSHAGRSPALAQRLLPLLMPLIEKAA